MGLGRHKMILLSGEVRYAHGLLVGGSTEGALNALSASLRAYLCEGDAPECQRLRKLLGDLEAAIEEKKKNKLLT